MPQLSLEIVERVLSLALTGEKSGILFFIPARFILEDKSSNILFREHLARKQKERKREKKVPSSFLISFSMSALKRDFWKSNMCSYSTGSTKEFSRKAWPLTVSDTKYYRKMFLYFFGIFCFIWTFRLTRYLLYSTCTIQHILFVQHMKKDGQLIFCWNESVLVVRSHPSLPPSFLIHSHGTMDSISKYSWNGI